MVRHHLFSYQPDVFRSLFIFKLLTFGLQMMMHYSHSMVPLEFRLKKFHLQQAGLENSKYHYSRFGFHWLNFQMAELTDFVSHWPLGSQKMFNFQMAK